MKINIQYNLILDNQYRLMSQSVWQEKFEAILNSSYPSPFSLEERVNKEFIPAWNEVEDKILSGLENFLKFKEESIDAYIVGFGKAHSEPLVIPSNFSSWEFVNVLSHEVIHRLLMRNDKGINEDILSPKLYPNEKPIVAIHIVLHAFLKYVHLDVLKDKARLEWDMNRKSEDYKRAWEIVEEEGYLNIINRFLGV